MTIEVLTTFDDQKQTVTLSSPWDGTATFSNHDEAEAAIQDALAHAAEIAGRQLSANKLRKLLLSIECDDEPQGAEE